MSFLALILSFISFIDNKFWQRKQIFLTDYHTYKSKCIESEINFSQAISYYEIYKEYFSQKNILEKIREDHSALHKKLNQWEIDMDSNAYYAPEEDIREEHQDMKDKMNVLERDFYRELFYIWTDQIKKMKLV